MVEPGDVLAVLPVGLKLWCKHYSTGKYHPCKVLERKSRAAQHSSVSQQHTAAVRSLADMGGIVGLPEPLATLAVQLSDHSHIYYIHYIDWDRRMDEWTSRDRMLLQSQIALIAQPKGKKQGQGGNGQQQQTTQIQQQQLLQRQASEERKEEEKEEAEQSQSADVADRFDAALTLGADGESIVGGDGLPASSSSNNLSAMLPPSSSPSPPPVSDGLLVGADSLVAADSHGGNVGGGHGNFSEADLQAHEEATKVKNVDAISFGPYSMSTWYYSPFPPEYSRHSILHFCEYCLAFFGVESELQRHARRCTLRHPPGYEIYRSQERGATVSMFEVDGQRETVYCFSDDTRLLTDRGFFFLHQLAPCWRDVLFACYNPATESLDYLPASQLVIKQAANHSMIDFTATNSESHVEDASTTHEGSNEKDSGSRSIPVSLLVTDEHDMYVALGERSPRGELWCEQSFEKVKAAALLPPDDTSNGILRLLSHARNGVSVSSQQPPPFMHPLDLHSERQLVAFLAVYGFWLGRGSISHRHRHIRIQHSNRRDVKWLIRQVRAVGLNKGRDWAHHKQQNADSGCSSTHVVVITNQLWFRYLDEHYNSGQDGSGRHSDDWDDSDDDADGGECFESDCSNSSIATSPSHSTSLRDGSHRCCRRTDPVALYKPFLPWALQLGVDHIRVILEGYRRAVGSWRSDNHVIFTPNTRLRDDLVHAFLHAGHSAHFELVHLLDTSHRHNPLHKRAEGNITHNVAHCKPLSEWSKGPYEAITAQSDVWAVHFSQPLDSPSKTASRSQIADDLRPALRRATDVKRVADYFGRVWCVTVPTGLVVAQRASVDSSGSVTRTSRPVVAGNCQNLCYLAKLFLDHKTLEFDATPFLFYVLCERDPSKDKGYHIVGYFSKEKISATGYNLAWSDNIAPQTHITRHE